MKNILSYKNPCFSGQEILDWANYQVNNKTGIESFKFIW